MTRPIHLFIYALAICILHTAPAEAQWVTTFQVASTAVLRIESAVDGERHGTCAGVVLNVESGYVLTAAHCIPPEKSDYDLTASGRHAELVRINRLIDQAVIRTEVRKGVSAIGLADATPPAGTPIAVLGFPFAAAEVAIQVGIIANPFEPSTRMTWVNAEFIPGDSGGALITADGKLVGLVSAFRYSRAVSLGEAVPLESVRDFVSHYLPKVPAP